MLCKQPCNCCRSSPLKIAGTFDGHYCLYNFLNEEKIIVCDNELASVCDLFSCKNTVDAVRDSFNKIIRNPALCGEKYPKLAGLLWVLGGDLSDKEIDSENNKKRFSIKEFLRKCKNRIFV